MEVGPVVGLTWVALGAFLLWGWRWAGDKFDPRYLWICGMGILAIAECWRRLSNREAGLEPPTE